MSAALAEPDDRQLVAALRQGDEAAFGRLVDRYHPSLIRIATLFVRDYAIAEVHLADAIEGLVGRSRKTLSSDRSPKNPY